VADNSTRYEYDLALQYSVVEEQEPEAEVTSSVIRRVLCSRLWKLFKFSDPLKSNHLILMVSLMTIQIGAFREPPKL
jgi:hypothetical protein